MGERLLSNSYEICAARRREAADATQIESCLCFSTTGIRCARIARCVNPNPPNRDSEVDLELSQIFRDLPSEVGYDVFIERRRVAAASRRIRRGRGRDRQRDHAPFVAHAKAYWQPFPFCKRDVDTGKSVHGESEELCILCSRQRITPWHVFSPTTGSNAAVPL
jgi:hypothetical protein